MKKRVLGVALFALAMAGLYPDDHAYADEGLFDGYSYVVLGVETLNYKERPDIVPLNTNTSVGNVALRTGGLFNINRWLDFSLDTGATLLPGTATETWHVDSGSAGDTFRATLPQPDSPVQHDDFRLSVSSLQVMLQYKHTDRFRSVYGIHYSLESFKRYNWSTVQTGAVALPQGSVEEDTSNLDAVVGLDFESGALARQNHRYQTRVLLYAPFWRNTVNTNNPDITFTGVSGFGAEIQGSYNYRFYRGMEIGIYASYDMRRSGKDSHGNIELPKNTLTNLYAGLQLSWNLSRMKN